jgi:hypothetical protein
MPRLRDHTSLLAAGLALLTATALGERPLTSYPQELAGWLSA